MTETIMGNVASGLLVAAILGLWNGWRERHRPSPAPTHHHDHPAPRQNQAARPSCLGRAVAFSARTFLAPLLAIIPALAMSVYLAPERSGEFFWLDFGLIAAWTILFWKLLSWRGPLRARRA